MKKIFRLIIFISFILTNLLHLQAQTTLQFCPYGPAFEQQKSQDSAYQRETSDLFYFLHHINDNQITTQSVGPLVIPVVVHVMHNTSESVGQGLNISYAQILSQIDRLNADYANDTIFTQLPSGQWAVNTGIQFCLAKNPMGPSSWSNSSEPGVMRYGTSSSGVLNQIYDYSNQSTVNAMLAITHPQANYFPFARYLNIWTVNQITDGSNGHFGGYSPEPLLHAPFPLDGVVMDAHFFGDNTVNNNNFSLLDPNYNSGNILAHEVGHYLSLEHTFRNGCAGTTNSDCQTDGDFICDTPPNTNTTGSCNASATCTENISPWGNRPDMVENYMTWVDDNCMTTFTYEQATVMRTYLTYMRSGLVEDTNLAITGVAGPNGCIPAILTASFNSPLNFCINQTVTFHAYAGPNFANSLFSWTFGNAIPSTSTVQNPSVIFSAAGAQLVTLTVTDTATNSTATSQQWVYVSPCSSLQSAMGNWYFGKWAGISFGTGTGQQDNAAYLNHSINSSEASVSLSDTSGNLIFITEGDTIWDRNHQRVITNLALTTTYSKTQIIYAPHPLHKNWYYLIHGPAFEDGANTAYYSVIADSNGTIIPISLNDTLARAVGQPSFGESITAIPHCNGRDTWIILTGQFQSGNYSATEIWQRRIYVYLISPAGITNPNGISPYPYVYTLASASTPYNFYGEMKANKDGTRIAFASQNGAYLMSFDPATGLLSNDKFVLGGTGPKYGLSFSPDGNSLYVSDQSLHTIEGADITVTNPSFSVVVAGTTTKGGLQLGPDSLLYMIHDGIFGYDVDRLNNPNNLSNPGYVANAVSLNSTYGVIRSQFGFPNFIEAKRPPESPLAFTTQMVSCNTVAFTFPGCWNSYNFLWNFGDNTTATTQFPTHTYSSPGTYTVTLTVSIGSFSYHINGTVTIINSAPQITGPTSFCSGSIGQIQYSLPTGLTYFWTTTGGGNIISSNVSSTVLVTWSGSGTISCVVNNGPSCQFTTTLNVVYYQSPLANAGVDTITTCLNSVVALGGSPTATGGMGPYSYQWMPATQLNSTTSSNPLCTATTNTTYTLIVTDAHGCTSSDVITVIADSTILAPQVTLNFPVQVCDFSTTNNLQGFASPAGGTFSGPGVTGTNFNAVTAGGYGNYLVSYFYTASNGCTSQATDTIHVIQCCQAPQSGVTTLDQQASSMYGAAFNSTPVPVRINGTFYINNTFTIDGYNLVNRVRCAPNAVIDIKPGAKLIIKNGTSIGVCDNYMWNGIIIEPGGELQVLTSSTIANAKQAIVSKNGAKYTLDQANLRENYQNLIVESYTGQGLHPGTIVRSNIVGTNLIPPYLNTTTFSGIEVTGVDSIYIGIPTTTADQNNIQYCSIGIITDHSKAYIRNNKISYCISNTLVALPGCCATNTCQNASVCNPPPKGTSIWTKASHVVIGGPNAAYENRITNSTRGILCQQNSSGDIRYNKITNISTSNSFVESYAIKVTGCVGDSFHIQNNTMNTITAGIYFTFNTLCLARIDNNKIIDFKIEGIKVLQTNKCYVYIRNNTENPSTATFDGKYGIRVQNAVVTNSTKYIFIETNTIKRCQKDIWCTNAQYLTIDSTNNLIFATGTPTTVSYGIQVQNGAHSYINGNIVNHSPPAPVNDTILRNKLYGISVETNGFKTQVSNNGLIRCGTGVNFFGVNNYPSTVSCNSLNNNMAGIRMNNSYIGDQGNSVGSGTVHDNVFTFQVSNGQKTFYRNVSDPTSNWYCRTVMTASPTTNPNGNSMQPQYTAMNMIGAFPNAPQLCQTGCSNCNAQQKLVKIVQRTYPFDTIAYNQLYIADQTVLQQLKDDPSLMNMNTPDDSVLTAYYNSMNITAMGMLDDVQRYASIGDTVQASLKNGGVSPTNCIEMSQKLVNEIYLRTWAKGIEYFSPTDSSTLYSIAIQNVQDCGISVYDARVMLGLDIDDMEIISPGARLGSQQQNDNAPVGVLYPNPTSGDATYEIQLGIEESGFIEITDLLGQKMFSVPINSGENHLPSATLRNGVYIYRVTVNGLIVDAGRMVVSH